MADLPAIPDRSKRSVSPGSPRPLPVASLGLALLLLGAVLPPAAPAAPSVAFQTVDRSGSVRTEALPPGSGIFRIAVEGQPERRIVVDPAAPLRVLVEFDAPPLVVARARGRIGPTPAMRATQLRSDLARLATTSPGTNREARITHEYREVWSGAAVSLAPGLVDAVRRLPYVRRVVRDDTVHASLTESVHLIRADILRQTTGATGAGIRVGIVDTGIDYGHAAFGGGYGPGHRVAGGWDFANDDADPLDDNGHGTHVAGIVGGNGGGVVGVAPGVTLYAFKVLTGDGWGYNSWILAGLERALDPDGDPGTDDAMQVVNLSLGSWGGDPDDPMSLAIDHLTEAGVVCCVAAGNIGMYRSVGSPGTSRRAITVGATDKLDSIAFFSSMGPVPHTLEAKPDLMAPGVAIVSSIAGGGTAAYSGTSMATPHVTGCAALLRQLHPGWTPDDVKSALTTTAHALSATPLERGAGRVDALDAASAAVSFTPTQLAFGRMPVSGGALWARRDTLHLKSLVSHATTVTFPATLPVAPGASVTCAPATVTLDPGATAIVVATLTADPATTPIPAEGALGFGATLQPVCDGRAYRIPATFFRHATLRVHSEASMDYVVEDHSTRRIVYSGFLPLDEIPIPPGSYDVTASFYPYFRFVTRGGIPVVDSTEVLLAPEDATATQSFAYVDREGDPLVSDNGTLSFTRTASHFSFGWLGFPITPIATSPNQPDYELAWTFARSDTRTNWVSLSDEMHGVTGSQVHSKPDAVWHAFTMALPENIDPSLAEIFWVYVPFGDGYLGGGFSPREPLPPPREVRFDLALGSSRMDLLGLSLDLWPRDSTGLGIDWNQGPRLIAPRLRLDRGWPIQTHEAVMLFEPASWFSGTRMRVLGGLPVWRAVMHGSPEMLWIDEGGLFYAPHVWADGYGAVRAEPDPTYALLRGGVTVASGTLAGAGGFAASGQAFVPLPSAGPIELRLHREDGHAGATWGTDVSARFDTGRFDRDPPSLRAFQVQAGGEEADSIDFARTPDATVRFRLLEDSNALTAKLEARPAGGGSAWAPVPVGLTQGVYTAPIPQSYFGPVDLRLTAVDGQLNALELTWAPAFFSIPAGPPVPVGPDGRPLLALAGAVPNPARAGALTIQLTLPDDAPAELDVLDVAGRRVASRAVGTLGAGRHRVAIAPDRPMRPGIYFARLRRAGTERVTRLCVVE